MKIRSSETKVKVQVDDSFIEGRSIPPSKLHAINEKHTKTVGSGRRTRTSVDSNAALKDVFDYRVTGWENIEDINGNPLECNSENKALAWENDQDFCGRVFDKLNEALEERKDVAEKN